MTTSSNNRDIFIAILSLSLEDGTFIKATLSQPHQDYRWKRVVISPFIDSQGETKASFEFSDGRQVERKNVFVKDVLVEVQNLLTYSLRSAHVRLLKEELSFERTEIGTFRLKRRSIESTPIAPRSHNRQKIYPLSPECQFLVELGIASKPGTIRPDRYDKFRQIQKFIEIISNLIP